MRKYITVALLLFLCYAAHGQSQVSYRYWLDNDLATMHSETGSEDTQQFAIDLSNVTAGLHILHLQSAIANRHWSPAVTTFFVKQPTEALAQKSEYWFDQETETHTAPALSGVMQVDLSSLSVGLHSLHWRLTDSNGTASSVTTAFFVKQPTETLAQKSEYWFDNNPETIQTLTATSGLQTVSLDGLRPGLHALHWRSSDADGTPSPVATRYFMVESEVTGDMTVRLWIDEQREQATDYAVSGQAIELDVRQLPLGTHTLNAILMDNKGAARDIREQEFTLVEPLMGDANLDDAVDVADVVQVVNYILGRHPAFFAMRRADVNADAAINVADIVGIVNIITTLEEPAASARQFFHSTEDVLTGQWDTDGLCLSLQGLTDFTACQMTFALPEGVSASDVQFVVGRRDNHVVSHDVLDDGRLRVLIWSPDNSALRHENLPLVQLSTEQEPGGEVVVSDIVMVTPDGQQRLFDTLTVSEVTAISEVVTERNAEGVYDLSGRRVYNARQRKGLYIINGKKVIVR